MLKFNGSALFEIYLVFSYSKYAISTRLLSSNCPKFTKICYFIHTAHIHDLSKIFPEYCPWSKCERKGTILFSSIQNFRVSETIFLMGEEHDKEFQ